MTKSQMRRLKLNCLKALRSDTCEDCGKSDRFDILEFHHIVPRHTSGRSGWEVVRDWKWESLKEEYDRECALLCPNCHKIRHTELDAEYRDNNMNYNYRHMTLEDMLEQLEE